MKVNRVTDNQMPAIEAKFLSSTCLEAAIRISDRALIFQMEGLRLWKDPSTVKDANGRPL